MKKILYLFIIIALIVIIIFAVTKFTQKEKINSLEKIMEKDTFILGLDDSFPPMGFRNENNEIVGFDIDLATEVCNRLGVKLVIQPISWSAKEQELNSNNIDCIWNGMSITKEIQEAMCLSMPYLENNMVFVVKDNTITNLEGKKIGVQTGSSAEKILEESDLFNKIKETVSYADNITAFMDLEIGQIDAVFVDEILANYYITTNSKNYVVLQDKISDKEEYAIGFRKEDVELKNKIDEILKSMKKDGTVTAISNKWFGKDITLIGE